MNPNVGGKSELNHISPERGKLDGHLHFIPMDASWNNWKCLTKVARQNKSGSTHPWFLPVKSYSVLSMTLKAALCNMVHSSQIMNQHVWKSFSTPVSIEILHLGVR